MAMKLRKELRLDEYTNEMLEEMKATGKFGSEASIIRLAIQDFYRTCKNSKVASAEGIPISLEYGGMISPSLFR